MDNLIPENVEKTNEHAYTARNSKQKSSLHDFSNALC